MSVLVTSDLHLGHRRVSEYRGFGDDTDAHDAHLAEGWDSHVKDDDTVHVLGDLCISNVPRALQWIKDRPGKKHFVSGNHDGCHPMHRRWQRVIHAYQEVFDTVQTVGSLRLEGHVVMMSHFPYEEDHTAAPRYMEWRLPNRGHWLLHGHTHMATQRLHDKREIHVGVDAWGMKPVPIEVIMKIIREGK